MNNASACRTRQNPDQIKSVVNCSVFTQSKETYIFSSLALIMAHFSNPLTTFRVSQKVSNMSSLVVGCSGLMTPASLIYSKSG